MSLAVLVVDDVPQIVALVAATLAEAGYTVFKATSGVEAVNLLERESIDVLVTDVKMPDLAGPEVVRQAWESNPGLAVVFMTGYSVADEIPCEMLSRTLLITKPFMPSALKEAVEQAEQIERDYASALRKANCGGGSPTSPEGD